MTTPSSIDKTKRYRQRCKRRLRTLFVKPSPLNLSSHDYFRLSSHPYVYAQGIAFSIRWGSGYLPTRILPHYEETLHKIEAKLAALLGHKVTTLFEPNPDIVLPPHIDNTPYLGVEGTHGFGLRTEETLVCHFPKSFGSYATVIASSRSAKETLFEKNPILHKEQYLAPPCFLACSMQPFISYPHSKQKEPA